MQSRVIMALCVGLGLTQSPALSAETAHGATTIEEIVVLARKRSESLVDIPVSMNAFTEADIESAGIRTPHDFIDLTPNVTLVQTQNAGNSFINIRGISQARNSEMSAAVMVDGVLMANPAQFNQQLYDIEQIEVLRGPQGALYGRNAIGGAITVRTKDPSDEFEGRIDLGGDSGPGYRVGGVVSGPLGDSGKLKFRAALSYMDTDGYIKNEFLDEEADPYEDLSGRLRLTWEATDALTADLRFYYSALDTQALYFNIAGEADDTSLPVEVNNPGVNERDMYGFSLKLDFETSYGTWTSITAYDDLEELLTGDQYDFLPRERSWLNGDAFGGFIKFLTGDAVVDLSQTQFLDVEAWSQEIRFTSPAENRLRWIVGGYFIATDRFISTGNQIDRGNGVFSVKRTPRPSVWCFNTAVPPGSFFPEQCAMQPANDPSPQLGLLVDAQDNFAWAAFGEVAYDLADDLEVAVSLRYDWDERENTTLTEPLYDPTFLGLTPGDKRKESWDDLQPKVTLRYKASDDVTVYGGYSRGFRSGGFNQTGVGAAVREPGVEDLFDEQTADTFEVGLKSRLNDGRVGASLSVYHTKFDNAYFFFFDPNTSTQNLGTIDKVTYTGFELEADAMLSDVFSVYVGFGYTDSEIDKFADPNDEGNKAPLASEYTVNAGFLYHQPLDAFGGTLGNVALVARADYRRVGDTYWEPGNISKRSPIDLVDFRVGFDAADNWSLTFWAKNAFDEDYNAEFSPGPRPAAGVEPPLNFLFKAPPRRWGVDFTKRF